MPELNPAALGALYKSLKDVLWGDDQKLAREKACVALTLAELPAEQPPSGAMTLEQAREKASRLCRPARMGLCFEDVTEEFIRIDYAAERRTLEALQHAILHDDTDGDTLAWIERRLEGLKHEHAG